MDREIVKHRDAIVAKLDALPHANIVIVGAWFDTRAILPGNRYLICKPNYETWLIEPAQRCIGSLVGYATARTHVVPFAVSDYDGDGVFYQHPAQDCTNSLKRHAAAPYANPLEGPITTTTVAVRRLDTLLDAGLLPSEAHYVTLDVQGLALEALRGGPTFFAGVHAAWVESENETIYADEHLYPEVKAAFEAAGFDEVLRVNETPCWGDSLFINREFKHVDQ